MTDDVIVRLATPQWTLTADTRTPIDPSTPGARLLTPATAQWDIDTLPPQTRPMLATALVYDDGQDTDGWLYVEHGQPARLMIDGVLDGGTEYRIADVNGRLVEPTATNHPDGGVIYQLVVASMEADLGAAGAPAVVTGDTTDGVSAAYIQLAADEGFTLDKDSGASSFVDARRTRDYDATNNNVLDVLTTYVSHDVRDHPSGGPPISRYLAQDLLHSSTTPDTNNMWRLPEYQPWDMAPISGALELVWTGVGWTAQPDVDAQDGFNRLILDGSMLLSDVGEWRQTRQAAINRVELTGLFEKPAGGTQASVRRSHADLVADHGPNTRSVPSPLYYLVDAQALGDQLLGRSVEVSSEWSFDTLTLLWETMPDAQRASIAANELMLPAGRAYGRPMAVVGIDPSWRLTRSDFIITGRLMGLQVAVGQDAAGVVRTRMNMTIRAANIASPATWPEHYQWGITFTELAAMSPSAPTFANTDPDITIADAALIGSP
jgi:hypothetical protein